jgi:glucose/arabinose dehydrogenase
LVQNQGERGLLGLAFHPDYAQNRRFFVHYSAASDGDTTLAEYLTDANDPNVADPGSAYVFLSVAQPYANHNGGSIEFSPMDGFLYIGLGDGGSGNDPMDNAQNMSSYLGKMLRIDVDPTPFTNPPGNLSGPIWDLGLRNPYRFSFDACTGDLYIGDVGQNQYEEVNVEPAGEGGKNYGWRDMEGMHCNGAIEPNCSMAGFTLPVLEYTHSQGCSISGGYVYRGSKIPGLRGAYLYGDYCSGRVWFTRYDVANQTVATPVELTGDLGSDRYAISSFGQDASGEIYLVDHGGSVLRIDPE